MSFGSTLVANRGEIACRVMRAARAGYRTVAVYCEADDERPARPVSADEAVRIGPRPVGESYLVIENLLESGAQGARRDPSRLRLPVGTSRLCRGVRGGAHLRGPARSAIRHGRQGAAKRRMIDAGVPCVPGYRVRPVRRPCFVTERRANRLSGDGEGAGRRRRARHAAGRAPTPICRAAIRTARSEAESAFGDGRADPRDGRDRVRAMSRSRSSPTVTATSSISASATARSSVATRR